MLGMDPTPCETAGKGKQTIRLDCLIPDAMSGRNLCPKMGRCAQVVLKTAKQALGGRSNEDGLLYMHRVWPRPPAGPAKFRNALCLQ
jgi:hypothetical protein